MIAEIVITLNDHETNIQQDMMVMFARIQRVQEILELRDMMEILGMQHRGGGGGVAQAPLPQTAPKKMPPITVASDKSPFVPYSLECTVCMHTVSGDSLMTQCKHALHEKCMNSLFENGIDFCPLCRELITALVSETLPDSPTNSDDAPADAAPESPKAPEE
jgi:hypothetical protein